MLDATLAAFLQQLEADGRSRHTLAQYRRHVRALDRWLRSEPRVASIDGLDAPLVARFMTSPAATLRSDGVPKQPSSVNALRTSLRCFFAHLHAAGLTASNPARLLRRARCSPPPPRPIPDHDLRQVLDTLKDATTAADRRDRALLVLLAETGIRVGAALALDVEDVDLVARDLLVRRGKGGHGQRVVLSRGARDELGRYLAGRSGGPLFLGAAGTRVSRRQVQRRFAKLLLRAGVSRPTTLHSLRHRFATRLYARTSDVLLVKQALGHRSIVSTMVYVDADDSRLRAAIARLPQ